MDFDSTNQAGDPGACQPSRKRFRVVGLVILLFLLSVVFLGPGLGSFLIFETPGLGHADAALVLAGSVPDRAVQAGEMLRRGQVDSILLVNDPLGDGGSQLREKGVPMYSHGELNRFILLSMEIPEEKMLLLPRRSASTWQDALALRDFLETHPLQSVVVVTCKYHTYRSRLVFEAALAGFPVKLSIAAAERCAFDGQNWWKSRLHSWRVLQEWIKLVGLVLGYR